MELVMRALYLLTLNSQLNTSQNERKKYRDKRNNTEQIYPRWCGDECQLSWDNKNGFVWPYPGSQLGLPDMA